MSPEKQRIAIAKVCGMSIPPEWVGDARNEWSFFKMTPDYPNDLNAMHEAETWLFQGGGSMQEYVNRLRLVCGQFPECATASQRAEAFLRTLNLWKNT